MTEKFTWEEIKEFIKEVKPHWWRLIVWVEHYVNGKINVTHFQDRLPMKIEGIAGSQKEIDLTNEGR